MVVGGYINHYMDGGSGGASSISLAIEVYDARSGALLWSAAQGGMMEARQVHDFYLSRCASATLGILGFIARSLAPGIWGARFWPGLILHQRKSLF